jgi:large subunit ribosomal protein L3
MKIILGKKVEMSRSFNKKGNITPVTLVCAGPCFITQIKKKDKDGYTAIQVGFGKRKKLTKAERGHISRVNKNLANLRYLKEFRTENPDEFKMSQTITAEMFKEGDRVSITGFSKGRGFAGVVKRHGFHGQTQTHGHKHDVRKPGSIGAGFPEHVIKGMRMAGRMGGGQVTLRNIEVIKVDKAKNLIALKGAVPGARNGLVWIVGK